MGKIGYTTILGWMYELGLKLTETVCLAVIFGFSQDGESTFKGSRMYLAKRLCVKDRKTVDAALSKLCSMNLIEKMAVERNGVKSPEYKVTPHCLELAVSMGYGKNPQDGIVLDNHMENTGSHPEEIMDIITNNNKSRGIKLNSEPFDFANALVHYLGASPQAAADWAETRRAAGMHETRTAYETIADEVRKCCVKYGVTADECIRYAILRGWKTFEAGYEWTGLTKNVSQTKSVEIL